ncbi:MAG: SufE family protein [Chloroflexi bacterium]|jgi:cysteine desulfuration protein SufE|nr:SufE family protein [Anaerolineaceae bacterium]NLI45130.1 SufE family protein [Chloroflexota bacterium]HOE34338.1 SufE family protein [Anaerolineaceae bacterium]HOT25619.1 SufE family protein [Anaerolineaceae bacterium]HQH57253.1 SufE family protein [Anaerolineaceae bacterium]
MRTTAEIAAQISEEFSLLESWEEKYDYLIEKGQNLPEMPAELKSEEHRVKGCQSSVWFATECREGRLYFQTDSDSLIVKGLAALLFELLNGQPAEAYATVDLSLFDTLGFWRHLSSQRSNGLTAMVSFLKSAAEECAARMGG